MKSQPRVALGGIFTECNELGSTPIDIAAFARYELCRGSDLLSIESGVVGGMVEILRTEPIEPVPILFASACPGGPLTRECYEILRFEFLERLQETLPVDGVLFPFHGAAAAEHVGDIEGDLLRETRNLVGPHTPLLATLDLHAHVTAEMVRHADALIAWETYPHRDTFETGQRGARMMVDILGGRINPTMAMAKVPVVTGAFHGATEGDGPFARIMRMAKSYERGDGVLSTSAILIHPHLDQPNMGSGAIAITDDDKPSAVQIAQAIAERYWEARQEFEASLLSPAVAIQQGLQIDGQQSCSSKSPTVAAGAHPATASPSLRLFWMPIPLAGPWPRSSIRKPPSPAMKPGSGQSLRSRPDTGSRPSGAILSKFEAKSEPSTTAALPIPAASGADPSARWAQPQFCGLTPLIC